MMNAKNQGCPPCRLEELRRVVGGREEKPGEDAGAPGGGAPEDDGLDIVNIAEAMKEQEQETARMRVQEIGKLRQEVATRDKEISLLKQELNWERNLHRLELIRLAFRQRNQGRLQ